MDIQRFLAELPQNWESPEEPLDQQTDPNRKQSSGVNRLQLLHYAINYLNSGELFCQIGIDSQELTSEFLSSLPKDKAILLSTEQLFSNYLQERSMARIGLCFLPQFNDYRTHLLTLIHCQPWLAETAILITTGAKESGLKQANLDFLAVHPQARIGLSLGLRSSTDTSFGDGIQVLIWESNISSETNTQQWRVYRKISQTLIAKSSPSLLRFRSPQATTFSSQIVCVEDILSPEQNSKIYDHTIRSQEQFTPTGFYSDTADPNLIPEDNYRQSLKIDLESFPELGEIVRQKVLDILPQIIVHYKLNPVELTSTEMELVAHNHDHHYSIHYDNSTPETETRLLSYLYYFCKDPKSFWGGQLRVYDTERDPQTEQRWVQGYFNEFTPKNNALVFFQSSCIHEVLPVVCPSRAFEDSRFTINGWIRR